MRVGRYIYLPIIWNTRRPKHDGIIVILGRALVVVLLFEGGIVVVQLSLCGWFNRMEWSTDTLRKGRCQGACGDYRFWCCSRPILMLFSARWWSAASRRHWRRRYEGSKLIRRSPGWRGLPHLSLKSTRNEMWQYLANLAGNLYDSYLMFPWSKSLHSKCSPLLANCQKGPAFTELGQHMFPFLNKSDKIGSFAYKLAHALAF